MQKRDLDRQTKIHDMGFKMTTASRSDVMIDDNVVDYSKVKLGNGPVKPTTDATINLKTAMRAVSANYTDKTQILQAIENNDTDTLREISDFYYKTSGIYKRAAIYLSSLFKYDLFIYPLVLGKMKKKTNTMLNDYYKVLSYFDESEPKKLCNKFALEIIRHGCYYGYRIEKDDKIVVQDLPQKYCRSKYFIDGYPAIEFNMKFFDDSFKNKAYREKILAIFPDDFQKGYRLYSEGKLPAENPGEEQAGWYLLNPEYAFKLNLNDSDAPFLIDAVPAIIDLDEAQEIDRKRSLQQLMKILIQKLPVDKNGDLIFDVDEAKDLHTNAVDMLSRAIGVDVLTTFADIDVKDMDTTTSITSKADSLTKVERGVYNQMGFSRNLFNTEGNLALEKSINNDEASLLNMIYQFQSFFNRILKRFEKSGYKFKAKTLETTIYNYKEMSKMYKEQVQLGYAKLLPQVSLGHSQLEILSELQFENDVLKISEIMIPAQMSSTMSGKGNLDKTGQSTSSNNQNSIEDKKVGREELPDDQKSEKTIQNKESMS